MNILINQDCHALLKSFDFFTFVPDRTNLTSSFSDLTSSFSNQHRIGTLPWMSPELLRSKEVGRSENIIPTKESNCYALGMVIFEVLSGRSPFPRNYGLEIELEILNGEHPERPEEVWFTDDLWKTLKQCWSPHPETRPTAKAILECLDRVSLAITTDSWQRLVNHSFSQGEIPSLLETAFWNKEPTDIVQSLQGGDTQALVDILCEVHYHARSKFPKNMLIYFHLNLLRSLGVELSRSPVGLPEQVHGLATQDVRSLRLVSPLAED